jgi:hypothetical protein
MFQASQPADTLETSLSIFYNGHTPARRKAGPADPPVASLRPGPYRLLNKFLISVFQTYLCLRAGQSGSMLLLGPIDGHWLILEGILDARAG